ncbi:unnamed protein product [Medioppia subpectinata]|uniref:Uncharacterized protein n=1 Tax=Medioppia subpectinata TaxID=1979941 RepID=A0A7R9L5Q9_9ACAR|nr:unnamed protein product [Medioppia subpectinata]CAG2114806.1 unnamed protein product [Medioppia subpectinata]
MLGSNKNIATVAGNVSHLCRYLDEPVPLPYLAYIVSIGDYKFGIYLNYIDERECDISVVNEFGTKETVDVLRIVDYKTEARYGVRALDPNFVDDNRVKELPVRDAEFMRAVRAAVLPGSQQLVDCTNIEFVVMHFGRTSRVIELCLKELGFVKGRHFTTYECLAAKGSERQLFSPAFKLNVDSKVAPDTSRLIVGLSNDGCQLFVYEKGSDGKWTLFTHEELAHLLLWWANVRYKYHKAIRQARGQHRERPCHVYGLNEHSTGFVANFCAREGLTLETHRNMADLLIITEDVYQKRVTAVDPADYESGAVEYYETPPDPMLIVIGTDGRFICDPEYMPVWDGIGASLHVIYMAIYLNGIIRGTLRSHLDIIHKTCQQ